VAVRHKTFKVDVFVSEAAVVSHSYSALNYNTVIVSIRRYHFAVFITLLKR